MRLDLERAVFRRRYQRFLADVEVEGRPLTVHVPNSGSMRTLQHPGLPCWIQDSHNPNRKLRHTLVLVSVPGGAKACVDTTLPNKVIREAIEQGKVETFRGYDRVRSEVIYGSRNSRIDLLLESDTRPPCYLEIKNCTMNGAAPGRSDFPDAVTSRGAKHLDELADLARAGIRAVCCFLVNRTDCHSCGLAGNIDPDYVEHARAAIEAGVELIALRSRITTRSITIRDQVPFERPS